ncbi:MAG: SRPBCC family protein [Parasphingopyxis sp.]|uniref:SRPBCC family protein n=1 Tax=Parasphingopyxis sp. TaxID=1920299 RepID=UPI003FA00CDA
MAEPFLVHTTWRLDHPVDELRLVLADPLAITRWWAPVFLHAETVAEGDAERNGYSMRCFTKGFLPHSFQFVARIANVDEDRLVIETQGDFDGVGTIALSSTGPGTQAEVTWSVTVRQPYLQPFLKILKPVFVWNHRWAMRQGQKGLARLMQERRESPRKFQPDAPTFPHNLKRFRTPQRWRV